MANPFGGLLIFLLAIISHVVTLAAGCVVTVVIGLLEKHVLKRSLSLKWEIAILLGFVFFACFQAWRDQYQRANELAQHPVNNPPSIQFAPQINIPPPKVEVIGPPRHTHIAFSAIDLFSDDSQGLHSEPIVLEAGKALGMNVGFHRTGEYPVLDNSNIEAEVFLHAPSVSMGEVDKLFSHFKDHANFRFTDSILTEPSQVRWRSFHSPLLSDEQAKGLKDGALSVWVLGAVQWKDETGLYETRIAEITQPPMIDREKPLWTIIDKYNNEVKIH